MCVLCELLRKMKNFSLLKAMPRLTGIAVFLFIFCYAVPYKKGGVIGALGTALIAVISFLIIIFLKRKMKKE